MDSGIDREVDVGHAAKVVQHVFERHLLPFEGDGSRELLLEVAPPRRLGDVGFQIDHRVGLRRPADGDPPSAGATGNVGFTDVAVCEGRFRAFNRPAAG